MTGATVVEVNITGLFTMSSLELSVSLLPQNRSL